jgi:Protein of unknown function (DUF3037)
MKMANERLECEFQVLRYVPDAVRNNGINIGVILRDQKSRAVQIRLTTDWRQVRCLDSDVDIEALEAMEEELREQLQGEPDERLLRLMKESLSTSLQISTAKGHSAESLPAGMEELMRMYVEQPPRQRGAQLSGRAAIQTQMRKEFELAGVWDLLAKRIPASRYTRRGDPLRIDLMYRPNGTMRMFHAVSLDQGVESAKVLAFSAEQLSEGVKRIDGAQLMLTAVIEPALKVGASDETPERLEMYRFGVETMQEHHIGVMTTSDLGRMAETARRELRV